MAESAGLIQTSRDPTHEAHGHEHRAQNQTDRNDRSRHFLHRLNRGLLRRHAVLDVMHHRLDDDDRIVDDDPDGEDEAE